MHAEKPTFLATRSDGFGERLKGLLNCMVLAKHFDGEFRFVWRNIHPRHAATHAVMTAEQTFAQSFRDRHLVRPEDVRTYRLMPLATVVGDIFATGTMRRDIDMIEVGQNVLSHELAPYAAGANLRALYPDEFKRIGFSPDLEAARAAAQAVGLPEGAIGLHLRAGDIIYGRYRHSGRYHSKTILFPFAMSVIEDANRKGRPVVIFGQDGDLLRLLADRYTVILADDLTETMGLTSEQKSMFDICLMSRCDPIHAGTSGFGGVAGLISNRRVLSPARQHAPRAVADILIAGVREAGPAFPVSALQKAASLWAAYDTASSVMSDAEKIDVLAQATRFDPVNPLYGLELANLHHRSGDPAASEAALAALLASDDDQRKLTIFELFCHHPDGQATIHRSRHFLVQAAQDRQPLAALLAAACEVQFGTPEQVANHQTTFIENAQRKDLPLWAKTMDDLKSLAPARRA